MLVGVNYQFLSLNRYQAKRRKENKTWIKCQVKKSSRVLCFGNFLNTSITQNNKLRERCLVLQGVVGLINTLS